VRDTKAAANRADHLRFLARFRAQGVVNGRGLNQPGTRGYGENQQREAVGAARHRDPDTGIGRHQRV
jgi:hypothetical protein